MFEQFVDGREQNGGRNGSYSCGGNNCSKTPEDAAHVI